MPDSTTHKQLIEAVYSELLKRTNPSLVVNVVCKYDDNAQWLFAARRRGNLITVTFGVALNDPLFRLAVREASRAVGDLKRAALDTDSLSHAVIQRREIEGSNPTSWCEHDSANVCHLCSNDTSRLAAQEPRQMPNV